jgi:hypothetical protein
VFSKLRDRFQNFLNTRTGFVVALGAIVFSIFVIAQKLRERWNTRNTEA